MCRHPVAAPRVSHAGRLFIALGLLAVLTPRVPAATPVPAANVLPNPTFNDADGDGRPEGWDLKTYVLENHKGTRCLSMKIPRKDKSSMTGEATTTFQGTQGYYRVTVSYLDENDGISKAKLLVNGKIEHIWDFDGTFGDCWRAEVIENVALAPGDVLTFRGRDSPSEYCRIRSITAIPSPCPPNARELEERTTPPAIADAATGPLVALKDYRDLSDDEQRPDYRPLIVGGSILVLRAAQDPADMEVTLNQPRNPTYTLSYLGTNATGQEKAEPLIKNAELAFDAGTLSAMIRIPTGPAGLYALQGPQGYWSTDLPYAFRVDSHAKDTARAGGIGAFYFFVPKGTTAFGIGAYCNGGYIAEVTVRAPDGTLVARKDVPNDAPQGIPIRVRPGQDDRAWSVNVSGVSPRIRLCGVPPYLATHPRFLLVPKTCVVPSP